MGKTSALLEEATKLLTNTHLSDSENESDFEENDDLTIDEINAIVSHNYDANIMEQLSDNALMDEYLNSKKTKDKIDSIKSSYNSKNFNLLKYYLTNKALLLSIIFIFLISKALSPSNWWKNFYYITVFEFQIIIPIRNNSII